jgi:DUF177 domain-containing protein
MTNFPLRRLRLRPGEEHRDAIAVQLEPFVLGGERYLAVPAAPEADVAIARATSGDVFRLRFETRIHGPCMRCLEDAVLDVEIDAQEYNAADGASDTELRTEYVVEDQLLLSTWARDAIALRLPEQIVCRADCAGLCPVCGKDLNREPHVHEDEVVDSRWGALEALKDEL